MKRFSLLPFLAVSTLAILSHGQEALTEPSGFQTVLVKGASYNLIGVNFLRPVLASGALESATSEKVTDTEADFVNALPVATPLWIELVDGPNQGYWSIITSASGTELNTVTDLSAYVTPGVRYEVRAATSIADIFGAGNKAGLMAGTSLSADLIWIPKETGGFDKVYYAAARPPILTAGWKMVGNGNADVSTTPIYHVEGIIFERRDSMDLTLSLAGTLKTTATVIPITSGFNYVERSFPVGATLGNSGLAGSVVAGTTSTADIVWLPNGLGGYNKYYLATAQPPSITAGWRAIGEGNADKASVSLTPGFIIERRGAATNMKITPDSTIYGGL